VFVSEELIKLIYVKSMLWMKYLGCVNLNILCTDV